MEEFLLGISSRINSPELQGQIWWLKILFLAVSAFFIGVILLSMSKTPYLRLSIVGDAREVLTYRPYGFPKIKRRWQRIMRLLQEGTEAEYKLAIIEADLLLDEMLQKMRLPGENIDERIQHITPFMISNLEELRSAHEIRNSIVYDPDYRITLPETRRVLLIYQRTLEDLDLFR